MSTFKERVERIRAESRGGAAPSASPFVLVVVDRSSVGRTVVSREVMSPFEQRRRAGTVPTGGTPVVSGEEGGALS